MALRGGPVVLLVGGLVVLFMVGVWVAGNAVRQEYHVLSGRHDAERPALDFDGAHAAWVERQGAGWAVVLYDVASKQRRVLEPDNATPGMPVAVHGGRIAWVEGPPGGPFAVRVHDRAANATRTLGAPGDNLTLPGRTLGADVALVAGTHAGEPGLWQVPLERGAAPRRLGDAPAAGTPLALAGQRLWWAEGSRIRGLDLASGQALPEIRAGDRVRSLDADGDRVAWDERRGPGHRVAWAPLGGEARDASAFEGDQRDPSLHGARLLLVQRDGLVRLVELDTGSERVMPARTQENRQLRLAADHAAWLSGTLEGHNVLLVPLRP